MLYPKEYKLMTEDEINYDGSGSVSDWEGWQKALLITGIVAVSIGSIYLGARYVSSRKFQPSVGVIKEGKFVTKLKPGSVPIGQTANPNYCYDNLMWATEGYFGSK